ncbi:uncharacterized protein LOC120179373 [Hibiscus syriacus]|uniref:uncharacterized protein LOC120179373 n=1 Tax=Hibiscus syriacus TaxID=106335 RepID=UPI001923BE8A|nr:uncharacterized protein LOC120179373 [Hibiscus syriacus]
MAANNNHPQMLKLLLDCKADKHATNQADLTALDVAQQHNDKESISMLRGCFIPKVSTFNYKLKKQMGKYVRKASWVFFQDIDHISGDDRNALLVILGLLLSSTYQATLSPPGGLSQDGASSGQSVLKERVFLEFYIMTYVVFTIAFFLTLALLKQFPDGFRTALEVLLAFFAICFNGSIEVIAPSVLTAVIIDIFSGVFFLLMVFMSITYEVSKLSVAIMGCSFLPVGPFPPYGVLSGLFFSLILFDEFWKGTGLILVFNLLHCLNALVDPSHLNSQYTVIITAFWFFFHLCRICIKRFIKCCNTFVN